MEEVSVTECSLNFYASLPVKFSSIIRHFPNFPGWISQKPDFEIEIRRRNRVQRLKSYLKNKSERIWRIKIFRVTVSREFSEIAIVPSKQPQPFQSLASVSMMILPTIAVAGSSPTLADNSEDSSRIDLANSCSKTDRQAKSLLSSSQTSSTCSSRRNVNCIPDKMDA